MMGNRKCGRDSHGHMNNPMCNGHRPPPVIGSRPEIGINNVESNNAS